MMLLETQAPPKSGLPISRAESGLRPAIAGSARAGFEETSDRLEKIQSAIAKGAGSAKDQGRLIKAEEEHREALRVLRGALAEEDRREKRAREGIAEMAARAEAARLDAESQAVAATMRLKFVPAASVVVKIMAANFQLSQAVEKSNRRQSWPTLHVAKRFCGPEFCSRVWLLNLTETGVSGHLWHPCDDPSRLAHVDLGQDDPVAGLGLEKSSPSEEGLQDKINKAAKPWLERFEAAGETIADLLKADLRILTRIEAFQNSGKRAFGQDLKSPSGLLTSGRVRTLATVTSLPSARSHSADAAIWRPEWGMGRFD